MRNQIALVLSGLGAFGIALATFPGSTDARTSTTGAPTLTPAPTVTLVPEPTKFPDDQEMPPTPPPPTPTPLLPEEGGPSGGVLGGHLYIDNDSSGDLSDADGTPGGQVFVHRLAADESVLERLSTFTDVTGAWQLRALPDGTYRVLWSPQIPEDQLSDTIPPAEVVQITTIESGRYVTAIVEIVGANRILDIDFGQPPQPPVAGQRPVQLPSTGQGGTGEEVQLLVLAGAMLFSALAGLGIIRVRTRR